MEDDRLTIFASAVYVFTSGAVTAMTLLLVQPPNQTRSSLPGVTHRGEHGVVRPLVYVATSVPEAATRTMLSAVCPATHSSPRNARIAPGPVAEDEYSVIEPADVTFAILLLTNSVIQTQPSPAL